jgi:primosomal protein N' (replication factor Y)
MIAAVAIPTKVKSIDRLFDYLVPQELKLTAGQAVEVSFHYRQVVGYVIHLKEQADDGMDASGLKVIDRVMSEEEAASLQPEMVSLVQFLRDRYFCSWGAAIQTVLPPVTRAKVTREYVLVNAAGDLPEEVVLFFKRRKSVSKKILQQKFGLTESQLTRAVSDGTFIVRDRIAAKLKQRKIQETELANIANNEAFTLELTDEQQTALESLLDAVAKKKQHTFVIHGVTGSGKTEIYLRAIDQVIQTGMQALMMVPEISLTAQMTARFRRKFGERVAVIHSRLSDREKFSEWQRILRGEADVVIGARSAVFAPLPRLGIAILDEEHESSYKQEKEPQYLTREVATWRATRQGAVLVLGSATPSLETMYRAQMGRYTLLNLSRRVADRALARVTIVNMRDEFKQGHYSLFSRPLKEALAGVLAKGEQAILFLNRRGYSTFLQCRDCGHVVACPQCDITLTLHKKGNASTLRCHFCGHSESLPPVCPRCGSAAMRQFGTGTQRVEHDLLLEFPGIRVIRMDVDTTQQKGAHERMLGEFEHEPVDVLLGTQMIAKGLDFERVSLVGVIAADTSLFLPDFRAAERTFQLLVQVAGRAGRHHIPGEMIVQTFSPEHYAVALAAKQDYHAFYEMELVSRKAMGYPPFTEITQFVIMHQDDTQAKRDADLLFQELHERMQGLDGVRLLPPAPATIARLRGRYRYQIIVIYRSFKVVRRPLEESYRKLLGLIKADTSITVDVNAHGLD